MTDQPTAVPAAGAAAVPTGGLEPDAIGPAQDTILGMANSAPAVSVGLTLAALAGATAYGSGPVILVTAVPMLIIANAYRRLNLWNAECGASFEWVGRAINPYLGFMTGWLMIAGSLIGTVSGVVVLAPSVLAIGGASTAARWPNVGLDTAVVVIMLVIAIAGIRITARAQVSMAAIEYVILIGFAILGLVFVFSHHHGTYPATSGWLSLSGVGGHGSASAGFLLAVFMFTGWDGSIYVNEEVRERRVNPGRAAVLAVALLALIYTLATVGLQGAVRPGQLQAHQSSALVYVAQALGGSGWSKLMALALALSVIASTGVGMVVIARIAYGMASRRVLPGFLARVSPRFSTPAAATLVVGGVVIAVTWLYLLTTSVQNVFDDLIDITGLLYIGFYILTALATMAYYRRRLIASARDAVMLGILPLAAALFLGWILVRSLQAAPAAQIWSIAGILAVGFVLLAVARLVLRSPFFAIPRESDGSRA